MILIINSRQQEQKCTRDDEEPTDGHRNVSDSDMTFPSSAA